MVSKGTIFSLIFKGNLGGNSKEKVEIWGVCVCVKKYNFNYFRKVQTAGRNTSKGDIYFTYIILKNPVSYTLILSQKQAFSLKTCHVSLVGLSITDSS